MKVYTEIPENTGQFKNPVVTIGNFDGVHVGHGKIISTLLKKSAEHKGEPFVITFRNHPRTVIHPGSVCRLITTVEEKQKALFELGVANVVMLEFTKEFSELTADEFYNGLLVERLKAREIVIGYDHAFGKNREGNIDYLLRLSQETGVEITQIGEESCDSEIISSTLLREEIDNGNMEKVEKLLGRRYTLSGKVVNGAGRGGKKLGFPTANILPDNPDKIIPAGGVYAVKVFFPSGEERKGMLNIGMTPTFDGKEKTIEVNIFDFNGDLYGENLSLEFYDRIRDEMKFPSAQELVDQITRDEVVIRKILDEKK
ncbi:MAG TPA: bifunctional riboflavin kinase/FAD synthetase [Spirochaetota bacterium]|nr:bifunctional riboflavin kinase/FAD synthetase [Spirochaetota bacterium]HPJ33232.1 bifunctional riboflavin kinase/FAD synthetase [Spirochaetota bacterium]